MSLRVLLADESDTIKKVFHLALQDLNAEVKSVHSGLDVIEVAEPFAPHIIFADVLLQKRNGYEVTESLKNHKGLSETPVILMWSSFMELDQEKYKDCSAKGNLEKPFDADHLRNLIKEHCPHAFEDDLHDFLDFPEDIREEPNAAAKSSQASDEPFHQYTEAPAEPIELPPTFLASDTPQDSLTEAPQPESESLFNEFSMKAMDEISVEEISTEPKSDFMENFRLPEESESSFSPGAPSEDFEKFESLNLSDSSLVDLTPNKSSSTLPPLELELPEAQSVERPTTEEPAMQISSLENVFNQEEDLVSHVANAAVESAVSSQPQPSPKPSIASVDTDEIEAIVRAHVQEYLQTYVRQNLAKELKQCIQNQLNDLLDEEVALKKELHDKR